MVTRTFDTKELKLVAESIGISFFELINMPEYELGWEYKKFVLEWDKKIIQIWVITENDLIPSKHKYDVFLVDVCLN